MTYSKIKGIIFDLGSTLIEFESRAWHDTAHEGEKLAYQKLAGVDHLPDFETFKNRLEEIRGSLQERAAETLVEWRSHEAYEKLFIELGLENPSDQARNCMDVFYGVVRNGIVLCDGALETVRGVKERGYRTGLISNTNFSRRDHELDLDNFGLTPYIDFRIYSSDFGFRKPHPGIYEEGLKMIGLAANETMYVGDRYQEDVKGPQEAGMTAILKYHEGREYPDPLPDGFEVIHKISKLLELLDREE
jgi:FMN phosphatase YigB (HAD superfamily)